VRKERLAEKGRLITGAPEIAIEVGGELQFAVALVPDRNQFAERQV
jgi:hypothetical protein